MDTDSGVLMLHALPAAERAGLLERATSARPAGDPAGSSKAFTAPTRPGRAAAP
ncbi:hypothetical protein OG689_38255 [Kitasatospora sp. NBC_00240]|uniref:hypothetical protein n=1 Tax=Kitasatospora sp. NBC_00240 TaxID=2903567 RepID=UPI0022530DA2|nr:hypothetical protein [Kitasatospora sp. NBC_00240]MCX5215038.1 hypothetical protein [Kitasatospora sp. NBC_00240]